MKKLSLILNIVLLVLVGVLFYLHFQTVAKYNKNSQAEKTNQTEIKDNRLKIAYVNLDSLEANYTYFQKKGAELDKKKQSIQKELATKSQAIQSDIKKLQEKAKTGTMTQAEGQAAEKKIMQKRQALQKRQQQLQNQLMQQQQSFNEDLHNRLNGFLEKYNQGKHYDYIFSYSSGLSPILYKNKAYNITEAVIDGLNQTSAE